MKQMIIIPGAQFMENPKIVPSQKGWLGHLEALPAKTSSTVSGSAGALSGNNGRK